MITGQAKSTTKLSKEQKEFYDIQTIDPIKADPIKKETDNKENENM
jgi:hypothetical protein